MVDIKPDQKLTQLNYKRTQFPLIIAEAITIHKSQGATYEKVAVERLKTERRLTRDLTYVAYSRATTANGLFIIDEEGYKSTRPPPADSEIMLELNRQEEAILEPAFEHLQDENRGTLQLMFHSIRSYNANHIQMDNDSCYRSSDILLFAETWTKANIVVSMDGFIEIARVNAEEKVAKPCESLVLVNDNFSSTYNIHDVLEKLYVDGRNEKMSVTGFNINDTFIASVYISLNFNKSDALDNIREILSVEARHKIIAGDFNTDFLDEESETVSLFSEYGLNSVFNGSINSTTNNATFIDNIFSDIPSTDSGRYISFTSDHDPLYMKFNFL